MCQRLRPTALLAFPGAWEAEWPPWGVQLNAVIESLEAEIHRRADRAKAERIKLWRTKVRETKGRNAAIYSRAADCSPTVYLRTPRDGSGPTPVYCPETASTDASTDAGSEADDGDFSPITGDPVGPDQAAPAGGDFSPTVQAPPLSLRRKILRPPPTLFWRTRRRCSVSWWTPGNLS